MTRQIEYRLGRCEINVQTLARQDSSDPYTHRYIAADEFGKLLTEDLQNRGFEVKGIKPTGSSVHTFWRNGQ